MSEGYRNGAFALGLVVGGGISLNLFLWLDYRAQQQPNHAAYAQDNPYYSQIGTYWDSLIGTFISPSDTLAQWIMATFTIAATIVLVFTLRSANKTNAAAIKASSAALEANQIMRDEQRPWIKFDPQIAFKNDHGIMRVNVVFPFQNVGVRPAQAVRVDVRKIAEFPDRQDVRTYLVDAANFARKFVTTEGVIFPNDRSKRGISIQITLQPDERHAIAGIACAAVYSGVTAGDEYTTLNFYHASVTTKDSNIKFADVRSDSELIISVEQNTGLAT